MTLTLKVTFHQQKQYLAVHESLGYLQHWASFGTLQRDPCKSDLATPGGVVTLGPITLPAVDAIRGDETISLAQFDTLDTSGASFSPPHWQKIRHDAFACRRGEY